MLVAAASNYAVGSKTYTTVVQLYLPSIRKLDKDKGRPVLSMSIGLKFEFGFFRT